MNKPTIIYLRERSIQPASNDFKSLPRRGAPIGVVAYSYDPSTTTLEFAFAMAHPKHDRWDRQQARGIVLRRLETKRETYSKQESSTSTGRSRLIDSEPRYFRIEIDPPSDQLRPYDALRMISDAHHNRMIVLPARLFKTIENMLYDNLLRNERLFYLETAGSAFNRVHELLQSGVPTAEILSRLGSTSVSTKSLEDLKEKESSKDSTPSAATGTTL